MKSTQHKPFFTEKHLENVDKMFRKIYNDELLTDVTLYCKDGGLKAHKIILAASSPYFRRIFVENKNDNPVFILHGINLNQLEGLLEFIYKGSSNLQGEELNSLYNLAEDFQLTGFAGEDSANNISGANGQTDPGHIRDTRFKGQKRVAVDYDAEESEMFSSAKVQKQTERRPSLAFSDNKVFQKKSPTESNVESNSTDTPSDTAASQIDESDVDAPVKVEGVSENSAADDSGLSIWAKKQRKFQCNLCPSSFKRASHLSRHQLVHTGERPYACDHCDKAFSRHDKLKHHYRKAHENLDTEYISELPDGDEEIPPDQLYTIGRIQILTPEPKFEINDEKVQLQQLQHHQQQQQQQQGQQQQPKKGRGRPRKYPPVPPPLIKRPRGRPRLNPVVIQDHQEAPPPQEQKRDNYDITNLPFGDIEYLTKPLSENPSEDMDEPVMMEPLVEIKTESSEKETDQQNVSSQRPQENEEMNSCATFLGGIGLFQNKVAKIGECTISVATNASPP